MGVKARGFFYDIDFNGLTKISNYNFNHLHDTAGTPTNDAGGGASTKI